MTNKQSLTLYNLHFVGYVHLRAMVGMFGVRLETEKGNGGHLG